jgi:hypothetical protein
MRILPTLLAMLATPSTAFMTPSPLQKKLYAPSQQNGVKQSSLFMSTTENAVGVPGTANLPWYKDGKWGEEELVEVRNSIKLSIHY